MHRIIINNIPCIQLCEICGSLFIQVKYKNSSQVVTTHLGEALVTIKIRALTAYKKRLTKNHQ